MLTGQIYKRNCIAGRKKHSAALFFLYWGQNDANLPWFFYKFVSKLDSGGRKNIWRAAVWPPLTYYILLSKELLKKPIWSIPMMFKFLQPIWHREISEFFFSCRWTHHPRCNEQTSVYPCCSSRPWASRTSYDLSSRVPLQLKTW